MINYYNQMLEEIKKMSPDGSRKKLLLHSCCGPCSTACLQVLKEYFDVTVLFYNPNIAPEKEYILRKNEQERYIRDYAQGVQFLECGYDPDEFYRVVKGYEKCPEGGDRCALCFDLRLDFCAKVAKEKGFDCFCTTLTVSPHKNAELINSIGKLKESKYGVKFLPSDFKKKNGFLNSVKLSDEAGLYRQNYCGCVFSLNTERE